jgi:hypothetical protein
MNDRSMIWPRESGVPAYFGEPGTNLVRLELPYPMRLAWDPHTEIRSFSCHIKVRDALHRIFRRTLEHYGHDQIVLLRLDLFGGCFNLRKKRGGSEWSMHAYGIAVDVDPEHNQLQWGRERAALANPAYDKFWQFVEDEGAVSLGRARNFDWMHFQFARP